MLPPTAIKCIFSKALIVSCLFLVSGRWFGAGRGVVSRAKRLATGQLGGAKVRLAGRSGRRSAGRSAPEAGFYFGHF